jgi:hypothetical protein
MNEISNNLEKSLEKLTEKVEAVATVVSKNENDLVRLNTIIQGHMEREERDRNEVIDSLKAIREDIKIMSKEKIDKAWAYTFAGIICFCILAVSAVVWKRLDSIDDMNISTIRSISEMKGKSDSLQSLIEKSLVTP